MEVPESRLAGFWDKAYNTCKCRKTESEMKSRRWVRNERSYIHRKKAVSLKYEKDSSSEREREREYMARATQD